MTLEELKTEFEGDPGAALMTSFQKQTVNEYLDEAYALGKKAGLERALELKPEYEDEGVFEIISNEKKFYPSETTLARSSALSTWNQSIQDELRKNNETKGGDV